MHRCTRNRSCTGVLSIEVGQSWRHVKLREVCKMVSTLQRILITAVRNPLQEWCAISESQKLRNATIAWLHSLIVRPAAALWRNPGDDLVRIHDVAGLAVHAVGCVEVNLFPRGSIAGFYHFVDARRAEVLA